MLGETGLLQLKGNISCSELIVERKCTQKPPCLRCLFLPNNVAEKTDPSPEHEIGHESSLQIFV